MPVILLFLKSPELEVIIPKNAEQIPVLHMVVDGNPGVIFSHIWIVEVRAV